MRIVLALVLVACFYVQASPVSPIPKPEGMTGFPEPEDYTGAPDDEDVTAAAGMTGFPDSDYTGPPEAPVTAGMTGFPEQDYTGPPEPKPTGADGWACAGGLCAGRPRGG